MNMYNNVNRNKSVFMKRKGLGFKPWKDRERGGIGMGESGEGPTKVDMTGSAKTPTGPTRVDEKKQVLQQSPSPTRTIVKVKGKINTRCCVGGLLVISGPYVGRLMPIYLGGNLVGRDERCEVSLPNDGEISAKQVRIEYFSLTNVYHLTHAEGSQSTYVMEADAKLSEKKNWRPLSGEWELGHGDYVRLSPVTTVRFISACDALFAWPEPEASADEEIAYRNPSAEI